MTSGSAAACSAVRTRRECTSHRSLRRNRLWPVVPRVGWPTGAARPETSGVRLVMLGDPVSGERLLGVEEVFDVVQDQVFQRAADEREVDLAEAGQPQLAPGVGLGEEVLAAEPAWAMRN